MPARKTPAGKAAKPATARRAAPAKAAAAPGRKKAAAATAAPPEADFGLIAMLKARALAAKREAKKSELLRAGLHALAALDRTALVQALAQLEPVKVGRPRKAR
jgi:hypothetical protein